MTARPVDDQHAAARQLEAFFLRRLLSEARPAGGGALDGGFAGDTFKQMLDEAIADKVTAAGGIGLADVFARQLGGATTSSTHALATATGGAPAQTLPGMPALALPVAGTPTSGFGARVDQIQHKTIDHPGFDLAAPVGTPVAAAAGGEVVHAGAAGTYGNLVVVRHASGYETRYAHLSAVGVKVGQRIDTGQVLGNVGSTGYSTGPHLHFEVRKDGHPIDPAPFLPLDKRGSRPKP